MTPTFQYNNSAKSYPYPTNFQALLGPSKTQRPFNIIDEITGPLLSLIVDIIEARTRRADLEGQYRVSQK